jgi:hypothetical protein
MAINMVIFGAFLVMSKDEPLPALPAFDESELQIHQLSIR